jgi:hypothetical protein
MTEMLDNFTYIINIMMGFAGVLLVTMIIVGGFRMGTAQGSSEKFDSGKATLFQGIIGSFIVLFGVVGGNFIIAQVGGATDTVSVRQIGIRDLGELEAPKVANVKPHMGGALVTFSEPVYVSRGSEVRLSTSRIKDVPLMSLLKTSHSCSSATKIHLILPNSPENIQYPLPSSPPTHELFFCPIVDFPSPGGTTPDIMATRFLLSRDARIYDVDRNNAILVFSPVSVTP